YDPNNTPSLGGVSERRPRKPRSSAETLRYARRDHALPPARRRRWRDERARHRSATPCADTPWKLVARHVSRDDDSLDVDTTKPVLVPPRLAFFFAVHSIRRFRSPGICCPDHRCCCPG